MISIDHFPKTNICIFCLDINEIATLELLDDNFEFIYLFQTEIFSLGSLYLTKGSMKLKPVHFKNLGVTILQILFLKKRFRFMILLYSAKKPAGSEKKENK